MANTTASESLSSAKFAQLQEEEGINKISSLVNSQRLAELKCNQTEALTKAHHKFTVLENMKAHSILRPKSNEKTVSYGSTGGSQSFTANVMKKPTLRLNTNLINQQPNSILTPQTTQNNHSTRMQNYQHQNQSSNSIQQHYRNGFASTPKSQSTVINVNLTQNQNYASSILISSKHRPQLSNSQLKQGTQGGISQTQLHNPIQTNVHNYNAQFSSNNDMVVKVGTSIPKTTTSANLKNFNNLRQFNQIFNQKQTSQQQNATNLQSHDKTQLQQSNTADQQTDLLLSTTNHQQKQSLLQLHQKHVTQHQQSKSNHTKQKTQTQMGPVVAEHYRDRLRQNPKNLQINIPASPRNNDQKGREPEENKRLLSSQLNQNEAPVIQSSLSTKNSNQGNIKLNKFTCHSTRNNAQKQNIFAQQKKTGDKADDAPSEIPSDSMQLEPAHKIIIPNHESTKHSLKRNGVVRAYAANTNQGLVRNYNEDRVSIILNILKPPNRQAESWPRCSFFGIYDGHGGSACADFLRDNLHQYVIREPSFPSNPKEALMIGFQNAEKNFLERCQNENGIIDKSGSCAIVVLIVEDTCYIANVGDSRAVLSSDEGSRIYALSRDHKPNDDLEKKRIKEGGGDIYYRTATTNDANNPNKKEVIVGPLRVLPGRLSVSRTFGDAEAKLEKFGGNPRVVIATPEIKTFKITKEHDFIVLGCDGIFDKLNNQESVQCVWNSVKDNKHMNFAQNIHKQSGMAVEYILKNALLRKTLDNVTVVMIAFNNFKHASFGQGTSSSRHNKAEKVSSSQASTDHSQIVSLKKKENIPPSHRGEEMSDRQRANQAKSSLNIDTNQNCNNQGLKTTTNAQLQRENTYLSQSSMVAASNNAAARRVQPAMSTANNGRPKHFDFANV